MLYKTTLISVSSARMRCATQMSSKYMCTRPQRSQLIVEITTLNKQHETLLIIRGAIRLQHCHARAVGHEGHGVLHFCKQLLVHEHDHARRVSAELSQYQNQCMCAC